MRLMRFDEAVFGLSGYRGGMHSWLGGDYAEIFTILRLGFTASPEPSHGRYQQLYCGPWLGSSLDGSSGVLVRLPSSN